MQPDVRARGSASPVRDRRSWLDARQPPICRVSQSRAPSIKQQIRPHEVFGLARGTYLTLAVM
jgi:hypothetical protein